MSKFNVSAPAGTVTATVDGRPLAAEVVPVGTEEGAVGTVEIISGPYQDSYDVAGCTVGYIRSALGVVYNIPPDAESLIDGSPVGDDAIVRVGECLEFIRASGRKGLGPFLTPDELVEKLNISPVFYEELLARGMPRYVIDGNVLHQEDEVTKWFAEAKYRLPAERNPYERLSVDVQKAQVTLDGEVYKLKDKSHAAFVNLLHKAKGNLVSSDEMRQSEPLLRGRSHLDRIPNKYLPKPIKELVKSIPGKGSWLRFPPPKPN
jgi:hypothetical protein